MTSLARHIRRFAPHIPILIGGKLLNLSTTDELRAAFREARKLREKKYSTMRSKRRKNSNGHRRNPGK